MHEQLGYGLWSTRSPNDGWRQWMIWVIGVLEFEVFFFFILLFHGRSFTVPVLFPLLSSRFYEVATKSRALLQVYCWVTLLRILLSSQQIPTPDYYHPESLGRLMLQNWLDGAPVGWTYLSFQVRVSSVRHIRKTGISGLWPEPAWRTLHVRVDCLKAYEGRWSFSKGEFEKRWTLISVGRKGTRTKFFSKFFSHSWGDQLKCLMGAWEAYTRVGMAIWIDEWLCTLRAFVHLWPQCQCEQDGKFPAQHW